MRLSRTGIALASALWTLMSGCADITDDDLATSNEGADSASETLAQVTPVTWPGRATSGGNATSSGPKPASSTPSTKPAATPTPAAPPAGDTTRVTVPDPNGVYFADITPSGNGCKKGTWNARLSADGLAFTITFSEYEVRLNPTTADVATKNCSIVLKMNSPSGRSYAVSYFSYQGYAFLQPGMKATVSTYYDFTGQAIAVDNNGVPRGTRTEVLKGQKDDDFLFVHEVQTRDLVYSQCGTTRDMLIKTSLILENGTPRSSGTINLSAIDGRTSSITLRLLTRPCTAR